MADSGRSVRAKICGLTRAEDAAAAVTAGADYLGVVFAGGPRRVTAQAAAEVGAAAGVVPLFGVFGEQSVDEILRISRSAALAGAQLHGAYRREDAARLRAEGLRVWRVVRLAGPEDFGILDESMAEADAVLVEPRVAHAMGGTGLALDLTLACEARARLAGGTMVLANAHQTWMRQVSTMLERNKRWPAGSRPRPSRRPWPSFDRTSWM